MKNEIIPLAMPKKLMSQVRKAAKDTHLSMADVMRQSMILGLPQLVRHFTVEERIEAVLKDIKPLSAEQARLAYKIPNPEFDALEHHCANLKTPVTQEED